MLDGSRCGRRWLLGIEPGGRSRPIAAPPPVTAAKRDTDSFATPPAATSTDGGADAMAVSQGGDAVDRNQGTARRPAAMASESRGAAGEAEVYPLPLFQGDVSGDSCVSDDSSDEPGVTSTERITAA